MIPVCDLQPSHNKIRGEIDLAIERVVNSNRFVLGLEGVQFEQEFAQLCGKKHCVGVNSGTDALRIALDVAVERVIKKKNINNRKVMVLTTPFSFFATAEVIKSHPKCQPVFCDVDDNLLIDVSTVNPHQIPDIIIPVDLYGQKYDNQAVRSRFPEVFVIEDACQAHGYKSYEGDIVCFSFFPSKNLGGFGDGGALLSDDVELMDRAKLYRNHGQSVRYTHDLCAYNSRLDEIQAAILRVKLPHLPAYVQERQVVADRYIRAFQNHPEVQLINTKGVFNQFTVAVEERKEVSNYLRSKAISTAVHYPKAIVDQEPFIEHSRWSLNRFNKAQHYADRVLSLPIYPYMKRSDNEYVIEQLSNALETLKVFK